MLGSGSILKGMSVATDINLLTIFTLSRMSLLRSLCRNSCRNAHPGHLRASALYVKLEPSGPVKLSKTPMSQERQESSTSSRLRVIAGPALLLHVRRLRYELRLLVKN